MAGRTTDRSLPEPARKRSGRSRSSYRIIRESLYNLLMLHAVGAFSGMGFGIRGIPGSVAADAQKTAVPVHSPHRYRSICWQFPVPCRCRISPEAQRSYTTVYRKTHRTIVVHKIVHCNHKERDINIDGGNPCLRKMHKIKGKQEAGQSCRRSIPCHFFPSR